MSVRFFLLFSILSFGFPGASPAAEPPSIPDFTKGDTLDRNSLHDWNLGPTGARGWVYAWRGESTASRQILITEIAKGSPVDGVLAKDDVILGLNGRPFGSDARIAFAKAITGAEAENGLLNLIRWRDGQTGVIEIRIPPIGRYSATAPYDCEKSERILEAGCEAIANQLENPDKKRRHAIVRVLNAMALLASGEGKYLPLIKKEAQWASEWEIQEDDLHAWSAGWVNLFLGEYLLVTGDESVRPTMNRLSYEIATGQSHVGTWGHRFAYEHNGILRGYGAMNQVGLSLTTSLVIAREAGADDPQVDEAIEKSRRFLEFYVGRGAIPYGDHHPWLQMHDDNGKASAAAVMFDFLGDAAATSFFSRMGTSSYGIERESGHTGNFFNMLWALPGVSRSGPEATGAWIRESAWMLDLARTWDGRFDFLGKPAATGGEHSYRGWDCTGAYLLGFSLDRKKIRFTGAKPSNSLSISREEAASLISEGRGWMPESKASSYESRTVEELLQNLISWSPVIRERAALALAAKKGEDSRVVPALIRMAEEGDLNAKFGACAALEQLGSRGAEGVSVLSSLLKSDDYWLCAQAAEALAGIGESARVSIPALLALVARPPYPDDSRAYLQRYLAFALFDQRNGLIGKSIESVDRDLLRKAAEAVLQNQDGRARASLNTLYNQLSEEEIRPLLPAIYEAVVEQSPSGVMFSDGIRMAGLKILAEHRIVEGLPLCIDLIELDRWGADRRFTACLAALREYGASAKPALPGVREFVRELGEHPKHAVLRPESRQHNEKMAKHYDALLEIARAIESTEKGGVLIPLSRP